MINVEEYILLPLDERKIHIRLTEPCIDRGCRDNQTSVYCKGLLAHILNTSFPKTRRIYVCHACYNPKCCNPNHLYWGTPAENFADSLASGRKKKSFWESMVAKYGEEKAREIQALGKDGKGRKWSEEAKNRVRGRKIPLERRALISKSVKLSWVKRNNNNPDGTTNL